MIRVLLVEDVRQTSELICELLDALGGFQVVGTCMTEHGALCWLEDNPVQPDIVVLDLVLREGSGFSLLGRLAGYGCDAVVFSDFASPAVADKCTQDGRVGRSHEGGLAQVTHLPEGLCSWATPRSRGSPPAAGSRWRQLSAAGIRSRRKSLERGGRTIRSRPDPFELLERFKSGGGTLARVAAMPDRPAPDLST